MWYFPGRAVPHILSGMNGYAHVLSCESAFTTDVVAPKTTWSANDPKPEIGDEVADRDPNGPPESTNAGGN